MRYFKCQIKSNQIKSNRSLRLNLFCIIFLTAIVVTGCGKDECECTVAGTTTTTSEDDVEGDLEEACKAANALLTSPDICEMK